MVGRFQLRPALSTPVVSKSVSKASALVALLTIWPLHDELAVGGILGCALVCGPAALPLLFPHGVPVMELLSAQRAAALLGGLIC